MVTSTDSQNRKDVRIFLVLLTVLGFFLVATTIRGPFIIDESNYLVTVVGLRSGSLFVPGTEGLTPSKELFYFDPEPMGRVADRTPVYSVVPPLYAPIVLPFSCLGWRGLVLLNTLSYVLIAFLVFEFVRHRSQDRSSPWIAAALTLFGGYSIEYAQGLWPQMFSVLLVVSAVYFMGKVWDEGSPRFAIVGGLLMGIATGIREQNIIITACLGSTLIIYSNKRLASLFWYGLGTSIPLTAIATIHYFRQGLWHPFPKSVAFSDKLVHTASGGSLESPVRMFLARVFDFSVHPVITDTSQALLYKRELGSGALLVDGVVKKALVQSSPWIAAAFLILVLVWLQRHHGANPKIRILRALSMLILPFLVFLSLAGGERSDGLAFNQRYFLEAVPLSAIALVLALDGLSFKTTPLLAGVMAGALTFALVLMLPSRPMYHLALLRVPLFMALLLVLAWIFRIRPVMHLAIPFLIGMCVSWGLFVHFFDDLSASRTRRARNAAQLTALESSIPDHSALFAYWGAKDAAGPLQLSRNVVILDVAADEGATAVQLKHDLQRQRRRVFVLGNIFPENILKDIRGTDSLSMVRRDTVLVYEVIQNVPAKSGETQLQ